MWRAPTILVERMCVKIVRGHYNNIKITTPEDHRGESSLTQESIEKTISSGKMVFLYLSFIKD